MRIELHEFIESLESEAVQAKASALADLRDQIKNPKYNNVIVTHSVFMRVLVDQRRPLGFYSGFTRVEREQYEHVLRVIDLEIVDTFQKELGSNWHVQIAGAQIWARRTNENR